MASINGMVNCGNIECNTNHACFRARKAEVQGRGALCFIGATLADKIDRIKSKEPVEVVVVVVVLVVVLVVVVAVAAVAAVAVEGTQLWTLTVL
jgi:hypothetical protein